MNLPLPKRRISVPRRDALSRSIEEDKAETIEAERTVFHVMSRQNELYSAVNLFKAAEDRLTLEDEEYKREMQEAGIPRQVFRPCIFSHDDALPPEDRSVQHDRRRTLEKMKIRLEETGGAGGEDVVKEYKDAEERDLFSSFVKWRTSKSLPSLSLSSSSSSTRSSTRNSVSASQRSMRNFKIFCAYVRRRPCIPFAHQGREEKEAWESSVKTEKKVISTLVGCWAVIVREEEGPVREGIDISVNLPNKKIKALMALSGGERSLTSVALLFALSQVNPPPFIILDETDAALDEANSKKYGDMVENLSHVSQLIVITHNRETMSRAGVIYGVTMQYGASKLLSIRFEEALAVAEVKTFSCSERSRRRISLKKFVRGPK